MKKNWSNIDWEKEIITLKLNHTQQSKTIAITKKNICIAVTSFVLLFGAGLYSYNGYRINTEKLEKANLLLQGYENALQSVGSSKISLEKQYHSLQDTTEILQEENEVYSKDLAGLEQRTNEIEEKIAQLDAAKDALYKQLDNAGVADNVSVSPTPVTTTTFEDIVLTPYTTGNMKLSYLSAKLDKLEYALSMEQVSYENAAAEVTKTISFLTSKPSKWPVRGIVSSEFSYRSDPINSSTAFHTGLDIRCPIGTPIQATASGTVIKAEYNNSGYGYMVEISHGNGFTTLYAHNSSLNVSVGDKVVQGDVIAYSGATGRVTGPHCHYEVKLNGQLQNPRDYL